MRHVLFWPVVGLLLVPVGLFLADARGQLERTDERVDRQLSGHVEKIDARDEHHGILQLRTSDIDKGVSPREAPPGEEKPPSYLYTFQVNDQTKILTADGKDLEQGLKNPRLARADVTVEFIDVHPGQTTDKGKGNDQARTSAQPPTGPDEHLARKIHVALPVKPVPEK